MKLQMMIMAATFAVTVITALIIIPILKKLKIGQTERDEGPKSHLKKQGTPTMGGVIFILAIIICVSISGIILNKNGESETTKNLIPILILTIGFGLIGFIDDFRKLVLHNTDGLKPMHKIIGLLIVSIAYIIYITKFLNLGTETIIPFFKIAIKLPLAVYVPFAILVILGTTNAVNLTDGIDGLSSSVCSVIITCLTVIAMVNGNSEITLFGSIVVGSILGFLMFNLHPAKVIMGDTGSLFLGGVISGIALYLKVPLLLPIIALIPVIETISVIIQVTHLKRTGNRVFKMAPIHHHFELSGWSENRVVMVFSFITLLVCIGGMFTV